jgi:hypothetical protein
MTDGLSHPLLPVSEPDRVNNLEKMLARGNHKSANNNADSLDAIFCNEVKQGWALPLPPEAAVLLPEAIIAPLGFVLQDTINKKGDIVKKQRPTHDQSCNPVKKTYRSVNDLVINSELTPCRFGRAMSRYIHYVCHLRRQHPQSKVYQTKVDWKAAYQQMHSSASTALNSLVLLSGMLLISLRLTFGGKPNQSRWSNISEIACALANDLVCHLGFDPKRFFSPHQAKLQGLRQDVEEEIPF